MEEFVEVMDEKHFTRVIAIGDIHGCSRALDGLVEAIQPTDEDLLVPLGDMIDRGPDVGGVIDRLMELQGHCRMVPLLGNHEEMFLDAIKDRSGLGFWLDCGGREMLEGYGLADISDIPASHIEFIKKCELYLETDSTILVHAGVAPNLPMDQQSGLDLLWDPLDLERIAPHYSGKTVIVGHTPQPDGDILDIGFLKCVDTGCHSGGWLTALDAKSGRIWQADQRGKTRTGRAIFDTNELGG